MPEPSSSDRLRCICGHTQFYIRTEGMRVVEVWFNDTENKNLNNSKIIEVYAH